VVTFLQSDARLERVVRRYHDQFGAGSGLKYGIATFPTSMQWASRKWIAATEDAHTMQPVAAAAGWALPAITSVQALADWLHLSVGELEWFADLKGFHGDAGPTHPLAHYRYRLLAKSGRSVRLIEAPKERLKEVQRRVLADVLDAVPLHEAVHGFRRGRSTRTFVAKHVGRRVVLRMDLKDFFPSIGGRRVAALFRTAGYPEIVADLLAGLATTVTPRGVFAHADVAMDCDALREARRLYGRVHLPQGAPTSPALANICAYRMDCRMSGLAKAMEAEYTRYADDLAFSGDAEFERRVERFASEVAVIAEEEGFHVHHRKTRVMRRGVRQHLAGLVTNERVNVAREEYDHLKATIYNCIRYGPESQTPDGHEAFRLHLIGRANYVAMIHAERGAKLTEMLARVKW
jgi:hypothetical protein